MQTEKRNAVIYINGVEVTNTLNSIRNHARHLNNEMSHLTQGTEQYRKKVREIQSTNQLLSEHTARVKGIKNAWNDNTLVVEKSNKSWENLKFQLKSVGIVMLGIFGVQALFSGFKNVIAQFGKLSDMVANVQKTTQLTDQQMVQLQKNFHSFNTRTPRAELLKLAEEAGRQGKNTVASVTKFVAEMDKIKVALGDELGEETISQIGKLSTIFNVESLKIANSVKVIADSSIASAPYQIDFMMRTAGVANTVKIAASELMGYGATLENLGQSQEVSGTAINQFLLKMVSSTEKFGEIAGFAKGELSKLIGEEGTNAGFIGFLKKLKEGSTGTDDLIQKLNDLGLDGTRNAAVLLTLANNTELLAKQQGIAKKAIGETDAIMATYNKNNETFGATLDRLNKKLGEIYLNNPVTKGVQQLVAGFANMIAPVKSATEQLQDQRIELNGLVSAITNANTSTDDRRKLIIELNEKYPEFLGNLDAEKVTNEQLRDRMELVNDEFIKKIALQTKSDEYQKMAEKAGQFELERYENIKKVNSALQQAHEKFGVNIKDNATLIEQVEDVLKQLQKFESESPTNPVQLIFGNANKEVLDLEKNLSELTFGTSDFTSVLTGNFDRGLKYSDLLATKYTDLANKIKNDYEEMKKTFSLIDDQEKKTGGGIIPGGGAGGGTGETEEEQKERERKEKEFQREKERLKELITSKNEELYRMQLSADEREIQAIIDKYRKEIELAKGHAKEIAQLEDLRDKEVQNKRDEQHSLLLNKQADFLQKFWLMQQTEELRRKAAIDESFETLWIELSAIGLGTQENWEKMLALWKQKDAEFLAEKNAALGEGLAKGLAIMFGGNKAATDDADKTAKEQIKIDREKWDAIHEIESGAINILGHLSEMAGGENTKRGRALALTQIAFSQAAAVADVVRMAMEAAADSGPLGPLVFAGYFAQGLAAVMAGIFQAKSVLDTDVDQHAEGGFTGDGARMYIAGEAGNEYIVPNWMVDNPYVANQIAIMEGIRQSRHLPSNTSQTSTPSFENTTKSGQNNNHKLEMLMERFIEIAEQGQNIVLPDETTEKWKRRQIVIDEIKNDRQGF